tara:strand:+ start:100 stop:1104 length:1005 start_codon:yes stop_codon:yes gene_type:complete
MKRHTLSGSGRGGRFVSYYDQYHDYQDRIAKRAQEKEGEEVLMTVEPPDVDPSELEPIQDEWGPLKEGVLKTEACGCPDDHSGAKIKITIHRGNGNKKLIRSFEGSSHLNQEVWDDAQMRPEVRERLQEIAQEFIENLDLPSVDIKDIILTGSLANFNWSNYSDLDVHIVVDFAELSDDEGFVKKYFDAVRSNWNRRHDIKVKGFDVELYIQDDDEQHVSTGVYSLLDGEWILQPELSETSFDKKNVMKKSRSLMRDVERVKLLADQGHYEKALDAGDKLKDKLHKMRKAGLDAEGVYSVENLTFKMLRRSGHMKALYDIMRETYDTQKSLTDQ